MNRAPDYLPILHEVEAKYGSIANAPDSEVLRVQDAAGLKSNSHVRGTYERGRQWQRFFRELDTEALSSFEILRLAQKDERLSENNTRRITISTVYAKMKKYGVKYKKVSEV